MNKKRKGFPFALFHGIFAVAFLMFAAVFGVAFKGEDSVNLFVLFFGIVGLLFTFLAVKTLIADIKKGQTRKRLLETGSRVSAEIVGVENANMTINNIVPYYLVCRHTENGRDYLFRSDMLTGDTGDAIGRRIDVWVNRDFSEYYVDADSLYHSRNA